MSMDLKSYKKRYGFDSPEEKYQYVKKLFNKAPLRHFFKGDYKRLEKYYRIELKEYFSRLK